MPTVVGVKLRFAPKKLWFDPAGIEPAEGDSVVVETRARNRDRLRRQRRRTRSRTPHCPRPLKPVMRVASAEDLALPRGARAAKEREAMPVFRELVAEHKLDMKPIDVEYLFDGDKVVFYFVAEERVDFRDLVKDLASRFKARIDMRQVGVRDEARMVGGLGHCGEQLCCVRFGGEFQPVSIRMAKEQDLPLNPLKISGLCGRLMCCLRYEYEAYKDFKSRAPKKARSSRPRSVWQRSSELNTPRETIGMKFEDGKRVTVPLAEMGCSKGTGCPCTVSRETLEEVGGTATSLAFAALDREAEAAAAPPAPAPKPRSGSGGGGRQRQRSPEERELPAESAAPAEKASPRRRRTPKGEGGRKRRRRGGRGGGEGARPANRRPSRPKRRARRRRPTSRPAPAGEAGAPKGEPQAQEAPSGFGRRERRRSAGVTTEYADVAQLARAPHS